MTKSGFDIDELERLLAAATPGEWEFVAEGVKHANATWLWIAPKTWHTRVARVVVYKTQEDEQEANAALIVALHNSAPAILTEIRELRATVATLGDSARAGANVLDAKDAEIRELRAENARLREALGGMLEYATFSERWQDHHPEYLAAARAALGEPQ